MAELYPSLHVNLMDTLQVSDLHTIFLEESGNPHGKPVLFLHGGPGAGVSGEHRRFFDPKVYRIILFDQRGAGRSTPSGELRENTTWDLINDIEKIRTHLKIVKWVVFGGSWGSTLALAYAIKHTDRVKALILRGIFLCRPSEIQWFYQNGASHIYPDYWQQYLAPIPESERNDLVKAYHQRLTDSDIEKRKKPAMAWYKWESFTASLSPNVSAIHEFDDVKYAMAFSRIECHYFINNAFFPTENYLLENAHLLANIPTTIVQGRYDMVCPMQSAWELKQKMPHAILHVINDAGHTAFEKGLSHKLVDATEMYKNL